MNNCYYVYRHTTPNGKVYIGLTCQNPCDRWKNGTGYINNPHFFNVIMKYGWDNIRHEILYAGLTKTEAEAKEIELIKLHKSNQFEYGYNRDNGGFYNGRVSEATKRKISESRKGMVFSEEHCEHIRQSKSGELNPNYGKKRTPEFCAAISKAHKGKTVSEKTRKLLSEINTGGNHPQAKPVICITTGKQFSCAKEAADYYGIDRSSILKVCKGKLHTCGGYRWELLGYAPIEGGDVMPRGYNEIDSTSKVDDLTNEGEKDEQ